MPHYSQTGFLCAPFGELEAVSRVCFKCGAATRVDPVVIEMAEFLGYPDEWLCDECMEHPQLTT